jgi:uncharacterized protein (DUF952 family)
MSDIAYKLLDRDEWRDARVRGAYDGSAVDRADGFIHLSSAAQLAETARRHYAGRDRLMLIEVDLARVAGVRWEASRGGALFPHVHGPLPVAAARAERPLAVDGDGTMRFEDGGPAWAD